MKKLMILAAVAAMAACAEAASSFYWSFQDGTGSTDYVRDGTSSGTLKSGTAYLFYATSFTSGGTRSSGYGDAVAALKSAIESGTYSFGDNWDAYIVDPTGGAGFRNGVNAIAKYDISEGRLYYNGKIVSNSSNLPVLTTDKNLPIHVQDTFFMVFTTDSLKEGDEGTYYCVEANAAQTINPFSDGYQWAVPVAREISGLTSDPANWAAYSVPEPTSGLLLLLGVAGLALKRKRA